jgi:flagellar protein FliL
MSAATAVDAAPPAKGKKKLIIIIAAVLAVVLAGGGAALMMMKSKAAAAEAEAEAEEGGEGAKSDKSAKGGKKAVSKRDPKAMPVFVPLDPFTVNLADRNADRYAQIAVTLELDDPTLEPQLKTYMPAIRNNILLAIADRTAGELMERDGKEQLAKRIKRETSRALGYELPEEAAPEEEATDAPKKKKPKKAAELELPIRGVHFSNFIIQ